MITKQEALELRQDLENIKKIVNQLEALVNTSLELQAEQRRIDDEFFRHLDYAFMLTC